MCSHLRHYRRWVLRRRVLHAFHLPAVPLLHADYRRFLAPMTALTPARRSRLFGATRMNTVHNSLRRSPCFTHTAVDPVPSPTTRWRHPFAFARYPSAMGASDNGVARSGLRHCLADSPLHRAESRSSSYGPEPHLQCSGPRLTATPFFWLQAGERMPEEDLHLSDHVRSQAHEPACPHAAHLCEPLGNPWRTGFASLNITTHAARDRPRLQYVGRCPSPTHARVETPLAGCLP